MYRGFCAVPNLHKASNVHLLLYNGLVDASSLVTKDGDNSL
jgi:hypothetical protein